MKENLPKGITTFIKTLTMYFVSQQKHGVIHYSQFLSCPELSSMLGESNEGTEPCPSLTVPMLYWRDVGEQCDQLNCFIQIFSE